MPVKKQKPSSEEQVARQISAMGDSASLIQNLINQETRTQQIYDVIDRNVRHLEIMLAKSEISTSGNDLSSFNNAVTEGKLFIAVDIPTT